MKFFTRSCANGESTEEEAAAVPESYRHYLAKLDLPPPIAALSRVNTHDAYVLSVEHQPERSRLSVQLRCGDLQRGYSDVTIAFSFVTIDSTALETLQHAVRPARVEVLYDEIDRSGECFVYRLLLFPSGEVNIGFRHVDLAERPVADRSSF